MNKHSLSQKLCSAMAVIQHATHVAIFTWMLVEGIHLYVKLVKVFSVNKLYTTYITIGWGKIMCLVCRIDLFDEDQSKQKSRNYSYTI